MERVYFKVETNGGELRESFYDVDNFSDWQSHLLDNVFVKKEKGYYAYFTDYLDYGQDWLFTTICYNSSMGGIQILSPRQWKEIVSMDYSLNDIIKDIKEDKYFND